ncbi:Demethylsterigmatocystin 6-O-methyltransferase [Chaetomidium leptoderma]|uniref:Demethylsterigmatocystin 6-O-methyltransferase n=1 Tax=Chaetomidium leptoderma TaxID=669021 RepID=A0AAN6VLF0_9PEZI|nr:Demethylsterigmatocystin 6-O-methyltransferase [Chaetomidium leptoderma]
MASSSAFNLVQAAEALLERAKKLAAVTNPGDDGNELALRRSIAQTAKKIAFETAPKIDVVKADWIVIAEVAAWNIFIDWKAFDHIPLQGHISIPDLARALNAQESLVARISALLLATGKLLPGPYPHTLSHSRISPLYLTTNPVSALCTVAIGNGMKPYAHWPEYFRAHGRREPAGQTDTPFGFGWGHPELPPWEVKALYPDYARCFARSMRSRQMVGGDTVVVGEGALYDLSWVGREAAAEGGDEDEEGGGGGGGGVVVVDVGGGLGQLLKDVLRDVEGVRPGQCVLQDRREVIEEARAVGGGELDGVVMMEHDFHEEQPVKGALVYLVRRILLDYSDTLAAGILRRLAEALPADNPKARVIIMEERVLDVPTPQNCIVDLVMLNLGGKLRNEAMFRDLAAAAGLEVVGYYARDTDSMCVVECARA